MPITSQEFAKQLKLSEVNFSFNELSIQELEIILVALQTNDRAVSLDLAVTYLHQDASDLDIEILVAERKANHMPFCQRIGTYISTCHTLKSLNVGDNHLGDQAVSVLFRAMWFNQSITTLDLQTSELTDAIIPEVERLLSRNKILKEINLSYNNFSPMGTTSLKKLATGYGCQLKTLVYPNTPPQIFSCRKKDLNFAYVDTHAHVPLPQRKEIEIKRIDKRVRDEYNRQMMDSDSLFERTISEYKLSCAIHENILDFFDAIQALKKTAKKLFNTTWTNTIGNFIQYCIRDYTLINELVKSLSSIFKASDPELRDLCLYEIGQYFFAEAYIAKDARKAMLLAAYICCANISSKDDQVIKNIYYISRSLLSDDEHSYSSLMELDQKDADTFQTNCKHFLPIFTTLDNFNDMSKAAKEFDRLLNDSTSYNSHTPAELQSESFGDNRVKQALSFRTA